MKKAIFTILLVFTTFSFVFAQGARQIGEMQARQTAQSFVDSQTHFQKAELQLVSASNVFVYNIGNQGFVIISGNTVLPPVIGWSDQGNFPDMADAPENFRFWMGHYNEMIDFAIANNIQPEEHIQRLWDNAEQGVFGSRDANTVSPLVNTHWNQDCYYNEYCPATGGGWWGGGPCGHAYAGCVACAMAQVMKYWDYPATGASRAPTSAIQPTIGSRCPTASTITTMPWPR